MIRQIDLEKTGMHWFNQTWLRQKPHFNWNLATTHGSKRSIRRKFLSKQCVTERNKKNPLKIYKKSNYIWKKLKKLYFCFIFRFFFFSVICIFFKHLKLLGRKKRDIQILVILIRDLSPPPTPVLFCDQSRIRFFKIKFKYSVFFGTTGKYFFRSPHLCSHFLHSKGYYRLCRFTGYIFSASILTTRWLTYKTFRPETFKVLSLYFLKIYGHFFSELQYSPFLA